MQKEIKTKYYIFMVILCALFFVCGYKYGDSRGYEDGFNEGYRYDCKDEIGTLYKQVKANSKALEFTDSSMRKILHENDSLKRQEYYKKRHADSLAWLDQFSKDSLKYSVVAKKYSDSLNKVVGGHVLNIVQSDGKRNLFACMMFKEYRELQECKDGFNIRSRLDAMMKKNKKKAK